MRQSVLELLATLIYNKSYSTFITLNLSMVCYVLLVKKCREEICTEDVMLKPIAVKHMRNLNELNQFIWSYMALNVLVSEP